MFFTGGILYFYTRERERDGPQVSRAGGQDGRRPQSSLHFSRSDREIIFFPYQSCKIQVIMFHQSSYHIMFILVECK